MHEIKALKSFVQSLALAVLVATPVLAQQSPQSTPPASPVIPAPAVPAPAVPVPGTEAAGPREVTLEARSVLMLSGESTWDDGYENLLKSFETLRAEAKRAGLVVSGKPQAVFQETDDQKFKYDATVFIDREPTAALGEGVKAGKSLAGKAFVFNHVGAYDDIDSVYEAITAWLDEKGHTAKGAFVEEYVNEPQGSDDAKLELNIYVFVQ